MLRCLVLLIPFCPGLNDDPEVKTLIERLSTGSAPARVQAIKSLEQKAQAARPAIPALLALLKEPDSSKTIHPATFRAIERIGLDEARIPELLTLLRSQDAPTASVAARLLGIVGEPALDPLLEILKGPQAVLRQRATNAIFHLRNIPERAIPALVAAVEDPDERVRPGAVAVLGKMGPQAAPAVPGLVKAVDNKSVQASHALGRIGPSARDALPALRRALADPKTSTTFLLFSSSDVGASESREITLAETAAEALGGLGAEAAPAVPDLVRAMKDPRLAVRVKAVRALGQIGVEARDAVAPLIDLFANPRLDRAVHNSALGALSKIGEPAGPPLVEALDHRQASTRRSAALALAIVRPIPSTAVGSLALRLEDEEGGVRMAAALALGELGAAAERAVPDLAAALTAPQQPDPIRKEAAEALAKVGSKGESTLVQALRNAHAAIRREAANGLGKLRTPSPAALTTLTAALADRDAEVRTAVASTLGEFGPEAQTAASALEQRARSDPSQAVRKAATQALEKIRAKP